MRIIDTHVLKIIGMEFLFKTIRSYNDEIVAKYIVVIVLVWFDTNLKKF